MSSYLRKDDMPKRVKRTPEDVADYRDAAMRTAFPKPIKGAGKDVHPSKGLPFRREKSVGDYDECGIVAPSRGQ